MFAFPLVTAAGHRASIGVCNPHRTGFSGFEFSKNADLTDYPAASDPRQLFLFSSCVRGKPPSPRGLTELPCRHAKPDLFHLERADLEMTVGPSS